MEASMAREDAISDSVTFRHHDYVFEVILLGDSGVGKTALLNCFAHEEFTFNTLTTVAVDYVFKDVHIGKDIIKTKIADTVGQERYRSVVRSYYRHAHGVLLMYSIESMESFVNLQYWLTDFKKNADPNAVVILVGNKCDCENSRHVPKETALAFANENAMSFYETSAKESIDVDIAFTNVLKEIYNKRDILNIQRVSPRRQAAAAEVKVKSSCCS